MSIKIQHKFQSEIPDGNQEGVIKPSHWNDDHKITLSQDKIIGRASEGEGDAEEITCTAIARSLLEKTNAAGLRSVLELGSAALLDEATAANFIAAVSGKALSAASVWTAGGLVQVSYSSTITLDFSAGLNFEITLGGNPTLANPSNAKPGQSGCIVIRTNGTGRTMSYGNAWVAADGPLDISESNTTDYLFYWVVSSSKIVYSIVNDPA